MGLKRERWGDLLKRFSTMSIRPTPWRRAMALTSKNSSTESVTVLPLVINLTGRPLAKKSVKSSGLSGAFSGSTV